MGAPVVHFEIMGKNGKNLQSFYKNLFEWEIKADNPLQYGMVSPQSEGSIGGGVAQVNEGQDPYVTIYIAVDDPQAHLDKAVALGGKIIVPVTTIPGMVTFAQFADPEGNVIGLVKNE